MNSSRLKLWRLWGHKQRSRAHAKRGRQLAQNSDVHAPLAGLISRNHALANASEAAQLFLGQSALLPPFPQKQPRLGHPASIPNALFPDSKGAVA